MFSGDRFRKGAEASPVPTARKEAVTETRVVDPTKLGTIETPFSGGDKVRALKLPEGVLLGSATRQRVYEKQFGAENLHRPDILDRALHSAELTSEFPDGKGGINGKREFTYKQTPDGRIHSDSAKFERVSEGKAESIQESRHLAKEGHVLSARRVEKKSDGTEEIDEETMAYTQVNGEAFLVDRGYTKTVNGEVVYKSESTVDPNDPEKVITTVIYDKSGRMKPGEKVPGKDVTSFRNGYNSVNKLMED